MWGKEVHEGMYLHEHVIEIVKILEEVYELGILKGTIEQYKLFKNYIPHVTTRRRNTKKLASYCPWCKEKFCQTV